MPAPSSGRYVVEWEDGGSTFRAAFNALAPDLISFLWPFGEHGEFTFTITDPNGDIVTYEEGGITYSCWHVVGIPEDYSIPAGELSALQDACPEDIELNAIVQGESEVTGSITVV